MDRRFVLLLLSAALALVLGFWTFTPEMSLQAIIYGGYWAMLVLTVLFGWSLFRVWQARGPGVFDWRNKPRWPAALILGCGLLLIVHETYGFKILMDEVMLLGTSMSMHWDKTALVPLRGNDIQGAFQLLAGQLDKRPLLQPFLVSVLHDATGYRPENVFVLNTVLTFVFLTLAYATGFRIGGRGAGALSVLLLTSLPLLSQNATGGGFEMLNLVMILTSVLLAMRYMEKRDADSLSAFCMSSVLLCMTRYESVLFLLPFALTVAWVWWTERKMTVPVVLIGMPLMLVPYALHNKVFTLRQSAWEMASQPGYEKPFSISFVPDNIAHDLNFFFNTNGDQSNSLVLSVLGFIALPFFALWVTKTLLRLRGAAPARAGLALFSLGFAAHTLLMLCYFWGKFDDPVIRRLSLPLNLLLAIAIVTVATEINWRGRIWPILAVLTGVGFFAQSLPAMARHQYSLQYYVGREMDWRREFIAAHPERDYLVIDNNSIIWITHQVSSTPVLQALEHKENIVYHLRNHTFTAIYVFQRYNVDPDTGRLRLPKEDDLGPDYQLEPVWERRFTPLTVSRISRVLSVREGPTALPAYQPKPLEGMSPAEQEKVREQFLERFIKRLP
ncbi:MAG TPA: glycosyltransferase family 39 protein [Lacunisphaera sp.]|nr:glycosyltransferase family 39 protein [Lacunisphaera sp.]